MIPLIQVIKNYLEDVPRVLDKSRKSSYIYLVEDFNPQKKHIDVAYSETQIESKSLYKNAKGFHIKVRGHIYYIHDFKYSDGISYNLDTFKNEIEKSKFDAIQKRKALNSILPQRISAKDLIVGGYYSLNTGACIYLGKMIKKTYRKENESYVLVETENGFGHLYYSVDNYNIKGLLRLFEATFYPNLDRHLSILKNRKPMFEKKDELSRIQLGLLLNKFDTQDKYRHLYHECNRIHLYYEYIFEDLNTVISFR